jgi:hypothetical protein
VKVYEKLHNELLEEQREREMHIHSLEAMIEEKLSLINANSTREAELAEIASRAIQDKMQTEKHWRMVYLTHVFVNRLLRDKIDAEMNKFKTVEFAFKTIKTATVAQDLFRVFRMPTSWSASTSTKRSSTGSTWEK